MCKDCLTIIDDNKRHEYILRVTHFTYLFYQYYSYKIYLMNMYEA